MFADLFNEGDDSGTDSGVAATSGGFTAKVPRPAAPRAEDGFVGLQNQGSTCYMNALLQVMYMTPELRAGLFRVDPNELGFTEVINAEKEAAETVAASSATIDDSPVPPPQAPVDESLLDALTSMGFDEHGSRRALVATKGGGGVDAALNYYLEHSDDAGFLDPPKEEGTKKDGAAGKKKKKPRLIPLELQRLFTQLQHLNIYAQSTTDLTSKGFQWQGMDGRVQHDAHELNRLLLDALDKSLKHTTGEKLCSSLYRGELSNRIQCLRCGTVKDRREEYFDLMTQVIGCPDMASSIRSYLAAELLDGDNAYACEVCGAKCPAHKGIVLLDPLPPIVSFSLQRFDIDRRNWERVKVKSQFEFPLSLDMSKFVERSKNADAAPNKLNSPISSDPNIETEILREIRGSMMWLNEAVSTAMNIASGIVARHKCAMAAKVSGDSAPEDTSSNVGQILSLLSEQEKRNIRNELLRQDENQNDYFYELFSIITHCGSAYSGHYFAYIRDYTAAGKWKMPKEKDSSTDGASVAATDPEKTKFSTALQDQYRERSRGELGSRDKSPPKSRFIVNSDSPLGLLVRIILEEGVELDKEYYQTNVKSADHPTSLVIGKFGSAVKKHIKRTWKDSFSVGMTEFVRKMPNDLVSYLDSKECFVVWNVSEIEFMDAVSFVKSAPRSKVSSSTSTHDTPTDEMFALDLHHELNKDKEIENTTHREADWETVGKTGLKRVNDAGQDPKHKLSNEKESADAIVADDQEYQLFFSEANLINELGNLLLNDAFGEFWEFNDSLVSPVCLATIAKAFESTNSAYILGYRKKNGGETACVVPDAPSLWVDIVTDDNIKLDEKRAQYDEFVQAEKAETIDVCIRCPAHVQVDQIGGALLTFRPNNGSIPELWNNGIYVRCTNDTTFGELRDFVHDQISDSPGSYGIAAESKSCRGGAQETSAWGKSSSAELRSKMADMGQNICRDEHSGSPMLSVLSMRGGGTGWYPYEVLDVVAAKNKKLNVRGCVAKGNDAPLSYECTTMQELMRSVSASVPTPLENALSPSPIVSENGHLTLLTNVPSGGGDFDPKKSPPARSISLNMLLWNESQIGGTVIREGGSHEPRLFVMKILVPAPQRQNVSKSPVGGTELVRPATLWEYDMWVNGTTTVADICDRAIYWASSMITESKQKLVPYFGDIPSAPLSVYVVETHGTAKHQPKSHTKGIYAKLLFDGATSSVVRAVKKDSAVKDLQGAELIIEFTRQSKKMGLSEMSLSEIEATFRNNEIEVKFEFDKKLLKIIQQWPPHESSGKDTAADAIDCSSVATKVSVDYTLTLRDLKLKMLTHACVKFLKCLEPSSSEDNSMSESILDLCVNEMLDQVRVKLNSDLPGDSNLDESKQVSSVLKSGDILLLETGEPESVDSISLQCAPVFGNDLAVRRNPVKSGTKVNDLKVEQTFSICKGSGISIEDVRLSFLSAINAAVAKLLVDDPRNGADIKLLESCNSRLRSTNWAEEAADIPLGEISSTNRMPLLLESVVSSGLLKSKSLLLLEEGKPPVPGVIEVDIYIDTRDMALFKKQHSSECFSTFQLFVGTLSCELDTTLMKLQELVFNLCNEQLPLLYTKHIQECTTVCEDGVEGKPDSMIDFSTHGAVLPRSMENFVLREIRDDDEGLSGRCLWIRGGSLLPENEGSSDAPVEEVVIETNGESKSSASSSPNKKNSNNKKKTSSVKSLVSAVASTPPSTVAKSTMRRAKLATGSRKLIVQLLPPENLHSASIGGEGTMKLWVCRAVQASLSPLYVDLELQPEMKESLYCPDGLPFDVQLSAGPIPSLPQLKRAIERDLDIPFHSQRVFKLFSNENVWKDLDAVAEKRKKIVKGTDSLLSVPYLLKEGDLLCVVRTATTSNSGTAFGSAVPKGSTVSYTIDRPVDEQRRANAIAGASGVRGKKKKRNNHEVALRLAGDFDFSDDEN